MSVPHWAGAAAARDDLILRVLRDDPGWLSARILPRLSVTSDGCMRWMGAINSKGYGQVALPRRYGVSNVYVHRVAWINEGRSIPFGHVIDHLCNLRACANPTHMQTTTNRNNVTRPGARTFGAANAALTHCLRGHALSGDNVSARGNWRECVACTKLRSADRNALIRAAHMALGLTQVEYTQKYGWSRAVAESVLQEVSTVTPLISAPGNPFPAG